MRAVILGVLGVLALTSPSFALDVVSGVTNLAPTDAAQQGRLFRNGVPQDWSGTEPFPGVTGLANSYVYEAIPVAFAANQGNDVYYQVDVDSVALDKFISAYLNSYDPSNLAANWLGDEGSSGNYFPGDPAFFQVVVPKGNSLVLVINSTAADGSISADPVNYLVEAFSTTDYSNEFLAVTAAPEPGTWMLMVGGVALLGGALRSRRARELADQAARAGAA